MTADLTLICHGCRFPIEGDTGALRVTFADIAKNRQQDAEWKASHAEGTAMDLAEFLLGPDHVHWRAYHDKCEPEPDLSAYQIDAAKLRTWRDLARWTAHLMSKNWFAATDWGVLLEQAAGDSEPTTLRVLARAS